MTSDDKGILLNMALAWLRLAQQVEAAPSGESPPLAPEYAGEHEFS
jgi:hypothetical protein